MITPHFHSSLHYPDLNAKVGQFVSRVIWGDDRGFSPFCSMAVEKDGNLIAGVVYHNIDADAGVIELSSGAIDRNWLRPAVIRRMFGIAFDVLGCQLAIIRVSADNLNMCGIARRFGFSEITIPRMCGRDRDGVLFQMTDDMWRAHRLYMPPNSDIV